MYETISSILLRCKLKTPKALDLVLLSEGQHLLLSSGWAFLRLSQLSPERLEPNG